jgi:hypothetical protein
VDYAKKEIHFDNAKDLFKIIKKTPHLKEYGGDSPANKHLTQYLLKNSKDSNTKISQSGPMMMMGIPNLSSAMKLKAYM